MRAFARYGTIEYLGLGPEVAEETIAGAVQGLLRDPDRRREMSRKGQALVDGLGASRAAEVILDRRQGARGAAAEKTAR